MRSFAGPETSRYCVNVLSLLITGSDEIAALSEMEDEGHLVSALVVS